MGYWYDKAIIYHIYPLGFCGAPQFNNGNETEYRLNKIFSWIPHLKSLNINAVYFGPIFESTEHGYDTKDYMQIDKRLGDNKSFKKICHELHANGMKVILDGVFNHTGRDFFAFKNIQKNGSASPYCGWFQNLNFGGESPYKDNFWYEGWNGHFNLVKLNLRNKQVVEYIFNAISFWIDEFDIDGIRFDTADCIDFDFFKRMRWFCKNKKPDFWLVGELIHGDYKRWANPEMLDSCTNYECYKGLYSSHNDQNYFEIDYSINRQSGNSGIYKGINLYNFTDNHDVTRLASMLNNKLLLENVYTLMYTMPGIPSIYYGSEFAAEGTKTNNSDSALRPCLDLQELIHTGSKLCEHLKKLGKIYRLYPELRTGQYSTVIVRNKQLIFKKELNKQTAYIALNLDGNDYSASFSVECDMLNDVLNNTPIKIENNSVNITIPAFSSMIMVNESAVTAEITETNSEDIINENEIISGSIYQHYKGSKYRVICIANHSETMEELVVYQSVDDNEKILARPKAIFTDTANGIKRFSKV